MTDSKIDPAVRARPLRLWPGVALAVLTLLARFGLPLVAPDLAVYGVMGGMLGGVAILVWYAFFSRARPMDRVVGVVLWILALAAAQQLLHPSMATAGMGVLYFVYAIPVLGAAFVAWAVLCRRLENVPRRVAMVLTVLVACFGWALVRTGGISGSAGSDFAWRWSQTPEERMLAAAGDDEPAARAAAASPAGPAEWPGYRGPDRDGINRTDRIATDWAAFPPAELWRRPIGPGWSSFAVRGDLVYTQEQRGEDETVSCYRLSTGEPVWRHADPERFWEANGGAGPRGTPTLSGGRVMTLGGTGLVNVLDALDGSVVWSRNAASDTGAKVPIWGFAGSPLAVDDLVVVAVSGALIAYDAATGDPRWTAPPRGAGYSSPHLVTIEATPQILHLNGDGLVGYRPADGEVLWEHPWSGYPIVQPAVTGEGDILISNSESGGLRRVAVSRTAAGWTAEERWTSRALKPYYGDFVVLGGHAYGFDGSILACVDLADGQRKWKGGRYGAGQVLLLADQALLLVISEEGELALVEAVPDGFREVARFPAIQGKTWNHPVLVGDVLLVRNAEEMAAFRLAPAGG